MSNEGIMFKVGKESGEAVASIVNALEDKNIHTREWVDIGKEAATLIIVVAKNYKEIGQSFKDGISDQEQEELREGFAEGFNLNDDQTEEKVETYFDLALEIITSLANLFVKADG